MNKLTTKFTNWDEVQAWTAVFTPFILGWLVSAWLVVPGAIMGIVWFLALVTKAKQSKRRQLIEAMYCAWDHAAVLSPRVKAYQDDPSEPNWKPIQLLLSRVRDHHHETDRPARVFEEIGHWQRYAGYLMLCAAKGVKDPVSFEVYVRNNFLDTTDKGLRRPDDPARQRQEVDNFLDAAGPTRVDEEGAIGVSAEQAACEVREGETRVVRGS